VPIGHGVSSDQFTSLAALTDLLPINAELNSSGVNLFDDETNGATEDKTY